MSLPWFAFDIAAYVKDTMRLATEGHGAYLLLMLDYYANEVPPPDDDEVLASIAKLPVDVWKAKHRKVLAPFFRIEDGVWHHDRIEAEMLEAKTKHAAGIARAKAGADARWAKAADKVPAPKAKRPPATAKVRNDAPGIAQAKPQALPEQSLGDAHLTLTLKNSLSTDRDAIGEGNDPIETAPAIGTPIDPKFWPCDNHLTACRFDGADDATIFAEVAAFIANKRESGAFSNDWNASWLMWWKRWKEHQVKLTKASKTRAAPRVEVSGQFEPTEADWDAQCAKFVKNNSHWSKQLGPEPGMGGCRCPPEILARHGIKLVAGVTAWRPTPAKEPV